MDKKPKREAENEKQEKRKLKTKTMAKTKTKNIKNKIVIIDEQRSQGRVRRKCKRMVSERSTEDGLKVG